jgi:hypothetical protein
VDQRRHRPLAHPRLQGQVQDHLRGVGGETGIVDMAADSCTFVHLYLHVYSRRGAAATLTYSSELSLVDNCRRSTEVADSFILNCMQHLSCGKNAYN